MKLKEKWLLEEEGGEAGQSEGGQGGGQQAGGENQPQGFDVNRFAQVLGETLDSRLPRQEPQEKQMSDEDFRKITKYYGVTPDDVTDLFGAPPEGVDAEKWVATKAKALQRLLDGQATHAIAVGTLQSQYTLRDLQAQFKPIVEEINTKKFDSYVGSILEKNEVLKSFGDKGKELVKTAIGFLQAQGYKPRAGEDETQVILQTVQKLVENAGGQFQQQQQSGGGRASGMAGGVNGAGGSGAAAAGKKGGKEPWQNLPF